MDVTVIIPSIGRSSLVLAVESVLAQTRAVEKILVVADGLESESRVRTILSSVKSDSVEILTSARHGAPAGVRNFGLARVTTELVALLDDDDGWFDEKINSQLPQFEPGIVAVSANAYIDTDFGRESLLSLKTGRYSFRDLVGENLVVTSSIVCRTCALKSVGGFPSKPFLLEDYAAWLRLATRGDFWISDKPLVAYTRHSTHSVSDRLKERNVAKLHDDVSRVTYATIAFALVHFQFRAVAHCVSFLTRHYARGFSGLIRRLLKDHTEDGTIRR